MAAFRNRPLPAWTLPRAAKVRSSPSVRAIRLAWALFVVIGLPLGLMAALGPLAYAGIYLEPLRPFWRPWPPDPAKPFIGAAGFVVTFAYLAYCIGRHKGFHSGTVAGTTAARNVAEGRGSALMQVAAAEKLLAQPSLPAPPPEAPPAPPLP